MPLTALPALSIHQNQQEGPLDQYQKLVQLKALLSNQAYQQQMQPLQLEEARQLNQQRRMQNEITQRDLNDTKLIDDYFAQNPSKGYGDAAKELTGKISSRAKMALGSADKQTFDAYKAKTDTEMAIRAKQLEEYGRIYEYAKNLPDDQYLAQWPTIAQNILAVPENQIKVDPNQPIPRDRLAQLGPLMQVEQGYHDREVERRTKEAEAKRKEAENKWYSEHGMTPGVPIETQQFADWQAKNPGKGASDYLVWKNQHSPTILKDAGAGGSGQPEERTVDPDSRSILAQTGLSLPAFRVLTGQSSQLSRDAATRKRANAEAEFWANKRGVDVSTMADQYQAYNDVLKKNITRLNNTKIMEQELEGTIDNLKGVVNAKDLSSLRFANVAKIWAGQEVNDDLAQQYAMHLYQLRNELSAYGAATQGRSGNEITITDQREAEQTIKNGIASGSLEGLQKAVRNSTAKMGTVMQRSVDSARKSVWDLFGVGDKYKGSTSGGNQTPGGGSKLDQFWNK